VLVENWESLVDRQIREAMESGAFDDLPGKGRPLDLGDPLDPPLAGTMRRIFRDNGVAHPLGEARRAIEDELESARAQLRRDGCVETFRTRIRALNREIRLFNLRSPLPNFHIRVIDANSEVDVFHRSADST
jgi:hypothetical protein